MKHNKRVTLSHIDRRWPYIFWGVFLLAAGLSLWGLWGPVPRINHDNNYEAWLNAFDNIIKSGNLFPSWVKSFCFEHGEPLFVFYPPLFFYLAEIPRLIGLSLVVSVKIIVGLSFLGAFWTIYGLTKEFFSRRASLIAGLLYLTAPYHFALIYIRGAYAENLAYMLFPLILWLLYRLLRQRSWWSVAGFSLALAALILSNLPSLVIGVIVLMIGVIVMLVAQHKLAYIKLFSGLVGALSISSFYWLPLLINYSLVQSSRFFSGKYSFSNYFIDFNQYFIGAPWSTTEYYQLGLVGWFIVVGAGVWLWYKLVHRPRTSAEGVVSGAKWLLVFIVGIVLLINPISQYLWEHWPILASVQFPFRWLSLVFLAIALLGGLLVNQYVRYWWLWLGLIIIILMQTIFFSRPITAFRPAIYRQDVAYSVYGGIKAQLLEVDPSNRYDNGLPKQLVYHTFEAGYLPNEVDKEKIKNDFKQIILPRLVDMPMSETALYTVPISEKIMADGAVTNAQESPISIEFDYSFDQSSNIEYRQLDFPGWVVTVDQWDTPHTKGQNGNIQFNVASGQHQIVIKYDQPTGAGWGRAISLAAVAVLILSSLWGIFYRIVF